MPEPHGAPSSAKPSTRSELRERTLAWLSGAPAGSAPRRSELMESFRAAAEESFDGPLSAAERETLIDQATVLFEQAYTHLPLKEAMHAVSPVQRLKLLRERRFEGSDLEFHRELRRVFTSVRDLHTNYYLPAPYKDATAYLPLHIAEYRDLAAEGSGLRYVVSRVTTGFVDDTPGRRPEDRLGVGAEILYWNGVRIDLAVLRHAELQAGGNEEARRAGAVSNLTLRPLDRSLPPDEDWVDLRFRTAARDGEPESQRRELDLSCMWLVFRPERAERSAPARTEQAIGLGLDEEGDAIGRARVSIFAPHIERAEEQRRKAAGNAETGNAETGNAETGKAEAGTEPGALGPDGTKPVAPVAEEDFPPLEFSSGAEASKMAPPPKPAAAPLQALKTNMERVFKARPVQTAGGVFGHVRIYTFNVPDPNQLVAEFVRLVAQLPQNGLILDVRDNPGGQIAAGERLLQTLTPRSIEPQRVQLRNTPLARRLCRGQSPSSLIPGLDLRPWRESVELSVRTGEVWSQAHPMTSPESCNAIGQKYHGPVLLITSARCYSTTDFFIAGFRDHDIGRIVGTHGNTGAGGANVWTHHVLRRLTEEDGLGPSPFQALPRGARMRVAIRRSLRVGKHAGTPVEDLGVEAEDMHLVTLDDILHHDRDLLDLAGQTLAEDRVYALRARARHQDGRLHLRLTTTNLDRLDVFVDGRPRSTLDLKGEVEESHAAQVDSPSRPGLVDLRGYREGERVAARRLREIEITGPTG